jgi:hypothetical protein
MKKHSFLTLMLASAMILPVACAGNPAGKPVAQMTFANYTSLPLAVAAVNIETRPAGTMEGNFIMDPQIAAQNYLRARLSAQGGEGSLRAVIEEASVRKGTRESSDRVAQFLNVGGQDVFSVLLKVRFEHVGSAGNVITGKVLTARRLLHISEHASVSDREEYMLEGLEAMFSDLDREVQVLMMHDMRIMR